MTPVQSGISPGLPLLARVTTAQFSSLDCNPFGNPPLQWGSTCKALAALKSAGALERKVMFCNACKSPMSFSVSVFFDHLTDHDGQTPQVTALHGMSVIFLLIFYTEGKFVKYL